MEFPEIAHDRLLHQLDLPHQQHLRDTLAQAQQQQQQLTSSTSTSSLDEQTQLLPMHFVDKLLDAEEQYAVHADELLTTWEIVRFEWRQLVWLSAPMVRLGACADWGTLAIL